MKKKIPFSAIFFASKFCKGNQGGGLHQEQGSRAAEVGVLSAFSNFLDFFAILLIFFYIKYEIWDLLYSKLSVNFITIGPISTEP